MIRFLHGDREIGIEHLAPDTTILNWLRSDCAQRGTKEGCASGDCGACTVVLVRPDAERLHYEPVNACIATVGSLHGRQLITVEQLHSDNGWHPVQRAMIEAHGSQCGFCTPGFIMSLFALYHEPAEADRAAVLEALGGNLCRCTGYRPIIDAALRVLREAAPGSDDHFSRREAATLDRLRALEETEGDVTALIDEGGRYFRPGSAEALAALLSEHEGTRLIAGGTDLLLEHTQGLASLPLLADVRSVRELHELRVRDDELCIGAAVSHRDAQQAVLDDYPELGELIERFGSLQIRSAGTIAGNLASASPIGDWSPVLLALGGAVLLQSVRGVRRVAAGDFFTAYRQTCLARDEFISAVLLPRRAPGLFLRAYKVSKRYEDDISSVCAVFALCLDDERVRSARIAFGGMAATPARAPACERALQGNRLQQLGPAALREAVRADFSPISDARASAEYRLLVASNLFLRLQAEHRGQAARVHGSQGMAAEAVNE
jgi:xanthine dehydrogenase small subunit